MRRAPDGQAAGEPNWSNQTIWTGDNLDIMRGMNSASVDLIYLDPPFNSKHNYAAPIGSKAAGAAFKDTWGLDDVNLAWHGEIKREHPGLYALLQATREIHGDSMMSYLIYMAIRLMEMRRLLKPTGSIYLHCDPTASHYLKLLMDAVLGRRNGLNEISWVRSVPKNDYTQGAMNWPRTRDILLHYRASPTYSGFVQPFLPLSQESAEKHYRNRESDTGRRYQLTSLTAPGAGARGHPQSAVRVSWRHTLLAIQRREDERPSRRGSHCPNGAWSRTSIQTISRRVQGCRHRRLLERYPRCSGSGKRAHWLSDAEALGAAETDHPRVQRRGRHDP